MHWKSDVLSPCDHGAANPDPGVVAGRVPPDPLVVWPLPAPVHDELVAFFDGQHGAVAQSFGRPVLVWELCKEEFSCSVIWGTNFENIFLLQPKAFV